MHLKYNFDEKSINIQEMLDIEIEKFTDFQSLPGMIKTLIVYNLKQQKCHPSKACDATKGLSAALCFLKNNQIHLTLQ